MNLLENLSVVWFVVLFNEEYFSTEILCSYTYRECESPVVVYDVFCPVMIFTDSFAYKWSSIYNSLPLIWPSQFALS